MEDRSGAHAPFLPMLHDAMEQDGMMSEETLNELAGVLRIPPPTSTGRRRPTYHTGTQTGRSEGFELLVAREGLEVHPDDADALGIKDGDMVEVSSRRGSVRLNAVTTDAHDPVTETAEFKACSVKVAKVTEPEESPASG